MIYEEDYAKATSKQEFVNILVNKYPIKKTTALRRYYDLRKNLGLISGMKYEDDEKIKPSHFMMIQLEDMKLYNYNIDRKLLNRYGFSVYEINWLIDNEKI
jgi:hypothetical protein